jgi:hypothetical protein
VTPLILTRAAVSRPSGQWRDDDYNVLENGVVVGRIFKVPVAPEGRPWMWASGLRLSQRPHADALLRGITRGCDGGIRQELAAGVKRLQ